MATVLKKLLTFTNLAAGGTSSQNHGLNVQGLLKIPDHIHFDNANFNLVSATTTIITVVNNGGVAATGRVLCELWHTYERAFGNSLTDYVEQLPNPPFVTRGASGSSGGGTALAFTYTCTGVEGSDFFITLPVAQATDNYIVNVELGGTSVIYEMDCPDLLAGDRTTTQFRVITTASVVSGDRLDVLVTMRA